MTKEQFRKLKLHGYTKVKWTAVYEGYLTGVDASTNRIWIGKTPNTPKEESREFNADVLRDVINVADRRPLLHEQLKLCDERIKALRDRLAKRRGETEDDEKALREAIDNRLKISKELDHQ